MTRSQKRLIWLLLSVAGLLLASTVVYMAGMAALEGQPRSFWDAFEWAGETLTTTGYGADASWRHPLMVVFVVLVQFIGVFLVFLIFPIYLIPFLEERFEARLPVEAPELEGHVLIYRFGPAVATLVHQAERAGLQTVVLEHDEAVARRLFDRGQRVVFGRLEDGGLAAAGLARARALIANGADDENAAVILAARQAGFGGDVLALVEEPFHRKPMMLAGATAVYTPRHILGAALAARASRRISPRVAGVPAAGAQARGGRGADRAGEQARRPHPGRGGHRRPHRGDGDRPVDRRPSGHPADGEHAPGTRGHRGGGGQPRGDRPVHRAAAGAPSPSAATGRSSSAATARWARRWSSCCGTPAKRCG